MSRKEFEDELGAYLKSKKKKKIDVVGMIKGMMPKPTPPPVQLPPEIQTYGEEEEKIEKKAAQKTEEMPHVEVFGEPKAEEEYEAAVKKPFWHGILSKVGMKKSKAAIEEEKIIKEKGEEEKIKDMVEKEFMLKDIKSLAKMTLFVIKQLPKERMDQFKQTSDFSDLKELLKKYKLIK